MSQTKHSSSGFKAREPTARQRRREPQSNNYRFWNVRGLRTGTENELEVWHALLYRARGVKEKLRPHVRSVELWCDPIHPALWLPTLQRCLRQAHHPGSAQGRVHARRARVAFGKRSSQRPCLEATDIRSGAKDLGPRRS